MRHIRRNPGPPQSSTNADICSRLLNVLEHRGPDDYGRERGNNWMLGFRRLAILDLSPAGHQPMCTPDGRHWLASTVRSTIIWSFAARLNMTV